MFDWQCVYIRYQVCMTLRLRACALSVCLQSVIQKADTGKVDWREFSAFGGVSRQRD